MEEEGERGRGKRRSAARDRRKSFEGKRDRRMGMKGDLENSGTPKSGLRAEGKGTEKRREWRTRESRRTVEETEMPGAVPRDAGTPDQRGERENTRNESKKEKRSKEGG